MSNDKFLKNKQNTKHYSNKINSIYGFYYNDLAKKKSNIKGWIENI